jgi:transposase
MPTAYSTDIRERVIALVESGGSRREAAEHFEVSASTAVKWMKRFHETRPSTRRLPILVQVAPSPTARSDRIAQPSAG